MSPSMSLKEWFEALMRQHKILIKALSEEAQREQETKAQNEFL